MPPSLALLLSHGSSLQGNRPVARIASASMTKQYGRVTVTVLWLIRSLFLIIDRLGRREIYERSFLNWPGDLPTAFLNRVLK